MDERQKLEKVRTLEKDIRSLECNLLEKKTALLKMDAIEDNDERIYNLTKEIDQLKSHSICTADDLSKCCNEDSLVYVADSILQELILKEYNVKTKSISDTLKLVPSGPHIKEILCNELKNFAINLRTNLVAELVSDNAKCLADIDSAISEDR